jgi:hypothetical protein
MLEKEAETALARSSDFHELQQLLREAEIRNMHLERENARAWSAARRGYWLCSAIVILWLAVTFMMGTQ